MHGDEPEELLDEDEPLEELLTMTKPSSVERFDGLRTGRGRRMVAGSATEKENSQREKPLCCHRSRRFQSNLLGPHPYELPLTHNFDWNNGRRIHIPVMLARSFLERQNHLRGHDRDGFPETTG
jgi:hypothetical protein